MAGREVYTFGEMALDVSERRLSRSGRSISLTPKAYDVLVYLVRHARRLVTKQELLDEVWPGCFVEEGILTVHVSGLRKALGDSTRCPRFIETVSRSGYRFIAPVSRSTEEGDQTERYALAVLPAQPSAGAASDADRSIGLAIADALIDRLGRYSALTVRPTRAIHTLTDVSLDPAAAGRALSVDLVVALRFDRTNNRLRIAAHLVRVQDAARVWSGEYDESHGGRPDIPASIAESINVHLSATSPHRRTSGVFGSWADARRGALSRSLTQPEVYELVGRGRSHLLSFSRSQVAPAIAAYEAAVERDRAFAPAHAGLALAFCMQAEFRLTPQADAYSRARTSALRALAQDDGCADAQVALGAIAFLGEWDWIGAERSLRRAVEINPSHTEAYILYGRLLETLGRLDDGLAMKMRALERDPFSPFVHLAISMSHWLQRHYDDAITWAAKTLELDPRHLVAREHIAGAYWAMGDLDRHHAEEIKHAESYGVPSEFLDALKQVYREGGRSGVVSWVLQSQAGKLPAMQLALLHSELGELDEAVQHLERAIDGHEPCLVELAVAPQWDRLRTDPRFQRCLARMGLEAPVSLRSTD